MTVPVSYVPWLFPLSVFLGPPLQRAEYRLPIARRRQETGAESQ